MRAHLHHELMCMWKVAAHLHVAAHDWSMCKSTLRAAEEKEDTGKPLEVGIGISNTLATH